MTPRQIEVIRATWASIEPISETAAGIFYDRLFELDPVIKRLFARTDMAVALPLLAARMPDAVPEGPGRWLPVSGNTGALEFPIRFTPGH